MISPYAAPTESRLSRIETSATTRERKATVSTTKLRPSTKSEDVGRRVRGGVEVLRVLLRLPAHEYRRAGAGERLRDQAVVQVADGRDRGRRPGRRGRAPSGAGRRSARPGSSPGRSEGRARAWRRAASIGPTCRSTRPRRRSRPGRGSRRETLAGARRSRAWTAGRSAARSRRSSRHAGREAGPRPRSAGRPTRAG